MDTAGSYADNTVTHSNFRTVNNPVALHYTDNKTGQIIIILLINSGHFRGFTPNQGATGLETTLGNPFDNLGCDFLPQSPHGQIIQKEQGRGAVHNNIIGAHGHQINADGIVFIHGYGDL